MACEEVKPLLEAYALGALESDETASVERHLVTCPDCRRMVEEYGAVVTMLPHGLAQVSPLAPPMALKTRVLDMIEAAETPTRTALRQTPHNTYTWLVSPRLWGLSSLAAVLLLVLAVVYIVSLNRVLAQEQLLRENLTHQTELIFEVVDSDITTRLFLRPARTAPIIPGLQPPYGKVFTRADLPYVVAMTGRLAPAPTGQAYYLWLFADDQAVLAGEMTVDEDGFGSLIYESDQDGPLYDKALLLLQAKNSADPTAGTPVLGYQ